MSANPPSEAIYSAPDGFVESLLHHSGPPSSQYPEPQQTEVAEPRQQTLSHQQGRISPQTLSKTRLRKACDSCSARKVKCDESGRPCRSCAALEIPCTFKRPSRRRGPPNRHAEAVKRQRLERDGSWSANILSPTEDAAHSLASLSGTQALSAESICDLPTLRVLIDDYFKYIHPLTPLPHEPTFRASFERREDRSNSAFLTLLTAMIEALAASFPRRSHQLFTSGPNRRLFPNTGALIDRCHQVFNEARGSGYLDRELTLYDAYSSYLIGLTASYLCDSNRACLYIGESISMMRRLVLHKTSSDPSTQPPSHRVGGPGETGYIKQELSRRLFWLCYVTSHYLFLIGDADCDMLMPLSARRDLPPLPLEVDDEYIYQDHIVAQPYGLVSIISGFNLNVRVVRSCSSLVALESVFGIGSIEWEEQKRLIGQGLHGCDAAIDDAPKELQVHSSANSEHRYSSPVTHTGQYGRHQEAWAERDEQNSRMDNSKRNVQYEIQRANIYASQLGTRSFLIERYWDLFEIQNVPGNGGSTPTDTVNAALDSRLQNAFNCPTASSHSRTSSRHGLGVGEQATSNEPENIVNKQAVSSERANIVNDQAISREPENTVDEQAMSSERGNIVSEQAMSTEQENIIRDLVTFLRSVDQINMQSNGASFCHKIRQIASTLDHVLRSRACLPTLDPASVSTYLTSLVSIITKMERLGNIWIRGGMPAVVSSSSPDGQFSVGPAVGADEDGGVKSVGSTNGITDLTEAEIEDRELVEWACLKECQITFMKENRV